MNVVTDSDDAVAVGTAVAREALAALLRRAENARARINGGTSDSSRRVSLRVSGASFPAYLRLQRHAEKVACNACWKMAERAGAVQIDWDSRAGPESHVERLFLGDDGALALYLGATPRWSWVDAAAAQLDGFLSRRPVLSSVLEMWRRGQTVRGNDAGDVQDWVDALRVLDHCETHAASDVPIRRLSASMFGDSKRVEALLPALDVLVSGDVRALPRGAEEVSAMLGLVRYPSTWLVGGELVAVYDGKPLTVARPYLGLAPDGITGFAWEGVAPRCLLTVENLTSFHELARERPEGLILLYTAGMPSPSWTRVYRTLLAVVPSRCAVAHWGDIDAGGFRIAAYLAQICAMQGRALELHSMAAVQFEHLTPPGRTFSSGERREILRQCERWGWAEAAASLGDCVVEQERMPLSWPEVPPALQAGC